MSDRIGDLIEAADMNGLLRVIDSLCGERDWEQLLTLAERCEDALERGKQLWPITAHVDYRLALEAPAEYAAGVLESDLTRFLLGPLTEVTASTHSWDELAPYLDAPHVAAYVAQERVLRGEDLTGDDRAHPEVLELPLRLEPWEPTYALATYRTDHVEVSEPWDPKAPLSPVAPDPAPLLDEPVVSRALEELALQWTAESNGAARAVVVEGDAAGAASHLTLDRMRMGPIEPEEALQRLAWTAASGGAHGRRRGAAFGRSAAWHVAALICDVDRGEPQELHDAMRELRWFRWDEGEPEKGWSLRLAVEDTQHRWAAAVAATDILEEEEER